MVAHAEPLLVVIRGASGSGKSTVTKALRHRFVRQSARSSPKTTFVARSCVSAMSREVSTSTAPSSMPSTFYAFDLSFAQTLDRHATRPEAAEFSPADMRTWYLGHQPLSFVAETVFDVSWSVDAVVDRIHDDLRSSAGRFGADDGRASGRKPI